MPVRNFGALLYYSTIVSLGTEVYFGAEVSPYSEARKLIFSLKYENITEIGQFPTQEGGIGKFQTVLPNSRLNKLQDFVLKRRNQRIKVASEQSDLDMAEPGALLKLGAIKDKQAKYALRGNNAVSSTLYECKSDLNMTRPDETNPPSSKAVTFLGVCFCCENKGTRERSAKYET